MPFVDQLNEAKHGGKTAIIKKCAAKFGWSFPKALRQLKKLSYEPQKRKTRSDKGKSAISKETLELIAALQMAGSTQDGKNTMPVTHATSILKGEGIEIDVSDARIRALLQKNLLDLKSLNRPTPYVNMRSLYPNHVHQVDPSLSRLYYTPGGLARIRDAEANRNKAKGFKKLKLWRYVLTDHYSGSVCMRYYESPGENQTNLYDFLLYAWGKKENDLFLFHGVPDILMCDSGSANISRAMTYALKAFDIKTIAHGVEKPRVKGQVEKANDVAEPFESRLKFEPQMTVEAINEAAEKWCAKYNANRILGFDSRLNRNGIHINRLENWLKITQEQLRELPPIDICLDLLTREPQKVTIRGNLFLSYEGRFYSLAGLPGVYVGMEVYVQPLLMREGNIIRVHYTDDRDDEVSIEVNPIAVDENSGFLPEAAIIGEEFKANKKTVLEKNAERIKEMIGDTAVPFGGTIHAISQLDIHDTKSVYMPRSADSLNITTGPVFEEILTPVKAIIRLKKSLGFWDAFCMEYLEKNYPACINESDLPIIESCLRGAHDVNGHAQTSAAK